MTFYNDSFDAGGNTFQSDPPVAPEDGFWTHANTFDATATTSEAAASSANVTTGTATNTLTFTYILPAIPEAFAYAYVLQNVQLSSRDTAAHAYIAQNVTNDIPHPHIWYVAPDAGNRGDVVAVVGTGFGATPETFNGYVTFGPTLPTVITWSQVPPSINPVEERLIHASLDVADPEHQRITFAIPNNAISAEVRVITNTDEVVAPPPAPPTAKFSEDSASGVEGGTSLVQGYSDTDVATAGEASTLGAAVSSGDPATGTEGEAATAMLEGSETAAGGEDDGTVVITP